MSYRLLRVPVRARHRLAALVLVIMVAVPFAAQTAAQGVGASGARLTLPPNFDGVAPPDLPDTVARNGEGQATIRAVRVTESIKVDGVLDEAIYQAIKPISDFIQTEPQPGAPATEKTEVWVFFDNDNLYVTARLSESQPERMVVSEMRRDNNNVFQNENFQFSLDTFHDRRNAFAFQFNPIGGRMDGQVANENQYNGDFNPLWRLQVRRTDTGWIGEAAVPFKSLRYSPGQAQVWGIQFRRINRWKNEVSYLTSLPNGLGNTGFQRVSRYATLVGVEAPSGGRALDVKPYVTSNVSTDRTASPAYDNKFGKDAGIDAKYAVTQNISADLTVKTDFAQVEADEQQVNLTRFSLFFPEKRDFFLENQGLFVFGGQNGGFGDSPTLFYSRRIGLDKGLPVPIDAGARLTGRVRRYGIGFMNIETGDVSSRNLSSNNFNVVRVRRDILRRSSVGVLFTNRTQSASGPGSAQTLGLDNSFAFFQSLNIQNYIAKTSTPGREGHDTSYRSNLFYNADRYGVQLEWLHIGSNFNPEVGFVRRVDFTKKRVSLRFSPRTVKRFRTVRKFGYQISTEFFDNQHGQMESRERRGEFYMEFRNSDRFEANYENTFELLLKPFNVATGVTIPVGGYDVSRLHLEYQFGQQRPVSGTLAVEQGVFYSGRRTAVSYTNGRIKLSPQVSVEPGVQINRVTNPFGDFTAKLVSTRATYTVTPLMFVSGLLQYNSSNNSFGTNVRFRWEYQPGSEFFVVYNDARDTSGPGTPTLQNRSLVFKVNRLFRF